MKLLYIGKSNKNFTHNKLYSYSGFWNHHTLNTHISVDVKSNKGLIRFNDDYYEYFWNNFKVVDEKEEEIILRKQKLKKINSKLL